MAQLSPGRRDSEQEFRHLESIPLTQVRDGAEALLTMEVSDDLMPLGIQAGEKPTVPLGADEVVAYYEKQLAATQLVQHRLQKQFNQLAEEKVALETSLTVQTAALQQQLVLAREKAERALAQAEHAQQQVQNAHAAVGEIVGAVTQLAELLDVAGASNELTHSFEAVAHSTQRTFQAVAAAQEGAQVVLELQMEARDACEVSPLLTAMSVGDLGGPDAIKGLEEEAMRLRTELEEAKTREHELEAEMHAAQLLFTGLEAEVVSLQHDQAQAAAKLQVSEEELVAARDQLFAARQALTAAESPEAGLLDQGLVKLDAHLSTIRSFIDSLSMPQPAAKVDASGANTLQLRVGRSPDGTSTSRNASLRDGQRGFTSVQMGDILAERDRLRNHIAELELHVAGMETEQESMVREHARRMTMAAAAGAAGAAAAVAVVSDAAASTASPSPSRAPSVFGVATSVNAPGGPASTTGKVDGAGGVGARALATLEQRAMLTEAALASMALDRDAALERAVCLEEEVEALRELLRQGAEGGLQQLTPGRGTAGRPLPGMKATPLARQAASLAAAKRAAVASGALADPVSDAGQPADVPLSGSPPSPSARPRPPSRTLSCRSDVSEASGNAALGEADDLFLEHGGPFQEMSRVYTRSSAGVHSSYQSFTSEAPLAPQRRYTDASEPHTYLLDPTETLEELLPPTAVGATLSLRARDGGSSGGADTHSLLAEVQQLEAAVCGLLVSKAIALAELQSNFDARLSALQAQHDAELANVQADQQQPRSPAGASDAASPAAPPHAATARSDKSMRVSEDGLSGGQYEAELLQHTVSLEVRIVELQEEHQRLVSSYEERLLQLQADQETRLAALVLRQQQEAEAAEAARHAAASEMGALQQAIQQLRRRCEEHEAQTTALREQHEAELRAHGAHLISQHSERCAALQAEKAAELLQLADRHEEETADLQAAHDAQLEQLRLAVQQRVEQDAAEREVHNQELAALQNLASQLRGQLAQLEAEHQAALADFHRQQSTMEELQRNLEDREGKLMLRESQISELQGQLQQLQSEKELEEQSLQSLLSTKAWMTDEIRSLQASLKEATAKLALVETRRHSSDVAHAADRATQRQMSAPGNPRADGGPQVHRLSGLAGTAPPLTADALRANAAVTLAADQLAEAAMQAALAEAQLETLQSSRLQTCTLPAGGAAGTTGQLQSPTGATGPTLEETTLMMETVVLQGELDELRGKHRTLQSQFDAMADELAYAVTRASLAELQLEELRVQRAGRASAGPVSRAASARANQQNSVQQTPPPAARPVMAAAAVAARSTALAIPCASPGLGVFTPSKPDELAFGADAPDLFGTDAFVPFQQARQLYRELRTVRRALGDLMVTDAVTNCAASREALSSVWEAVVAAQDKAANVARALQHHHHGKHSSQGAGGSFSGEEQPAGGTQEGSNAVGWDHEEANRAREGYRDACEVYEMLRSDAEEINSQLWRWSVRLNQQLSAKEEELTRAQVGVAPGPQLALESLLSKKEAYVRSVEGQVSELQMGLQAAQTRLLQRDGQVAALQDMLVQLSEQVTMFESVVVKCEVLSSDLVSKSAARLA